MMMASRTHALRTLRAPRLFAVAVALGGLAACSFLAPDYEDYSRSEDGGHAGASSGGQAGASVGGMPIGGSGSAGGGAGGSSGLTASGGEAAGGADAEAGAAGMAGSPEQPDTPAVMGQAVAAADYVLTNVIRNGLPLLVLATDYDVDEAAATTPGRDLPIYKPYDSSDPAWWDYLVGEQLQSRISVFSFPTRGVNSLNAGDLTGPGNMNPRALQGWVDALSRADASYAVSATCLVDSPYLQAVSNTFHNSPPDTLLDLSNAAEYHDIFWQRAIKPWFDTVPRNQWYSLGFNPLIQMAALPNTAFKNQAGHLGQLLTSIADDFNAAYQAYPHFILDASWFTLEPGLSQNPYVTGKSPWLLPPNTSSVAFSAFALTIGTVVPGFDDGARTIERTSLDPYGNEVNTLVTGLTTAVKKDAAITLIENLTNLREHAGLYRSNAADWRSPNEFLNLVRRYADPKTETLRLEAEGCDRFNDTTTGNSGKAFNRDADLDVRSLGGSGWAVTDTAPGEWIQFDQIDFSTGSYDFIARFSTSNSGLGRGLPKRLDLVVDGEKLTPIIVRDTANTDGFDAVLLGNRTLSHGPHDLRVRFLDGYVDLDWLFVRKVSRVLGLQPASGNWESAQGAGGQEVSATAPNPNIYEEFAFDDLNGGSLEDGDLVQLQCFNGLYLTVVAGTQAVMATVREPRDAETFKVSLLSGSGVGVTGSTIAISTADGSHYFSDGAGAKLDASGTSVGAAQTFTVHAF